MEHTEIIGIIAGAFTALSLLPQLFKLIKEKKANDLSVFYLITLFIGLSAWIYYGALRSDIPIIVTNTVSVIINIAVFILTLIYKKRDVSK